MNNYLLLSIIIILILNPCSARTYRKSMVIYLRFADFVIILNNWHLISNNNPLALINIKRDIISIYFAKILYKGYNGDTEKYYINFLKVVSN